jgi:hypothetical protein
MQRPLALTDDQLTAILHGAQPLRPHDRDDFLRQVANARSVMVTSTAPSARRRKSFSIRRYSRTTTQNIAECRRRNTQLPVTAAPNADRAPRAASAQSDAASATLSPSGLER